MNESRTHLAAIVANNSDNRKKAATKSIRETGSGLLSSLQKVVIARDWEKDFKRLLKFALA